MLLMNLRTCVHNFVVNMLIIETLFVVTALMVADASPLCSAYCNSLFSRIARPMPFDCDCRSLQEKNFKRQNQASASNFISLSKRKYYIQRSFLSCKNSYRTVENDGSVIKKKVTRGERDKNFQIDTKILSELIIHLILFDRKCHNTGFKASLQTDGVNNYKMLSDSELIEKIDEKCSEVAKNNSRKTNKNAMLADIIDKCLKKDNFAGVTFNVNSGKFNLIECIMDSIFPKDERTSTAQLPISTPMAVTSPNDLVNSKKNQCTIEYTNTVTKHDEINNITTQPKEHVVRITPDVPEVIDSTQNITSKMNSNKTGLENFSLNPLLNLVTTTIDYKYMDDNNFSDESGKLIAQNIINERERNHLFMDLPQNTQNNDDNIITTETAKPYNTTFTRKNLTTEILAEEINETAVLARSAINPIQDENTYRPLANSPESSNLEINDNKKSSFRRNKNREHYNESDVPVVRIISREYPNDTVSSIINGTEIVPNDDFKGKNNIGNQNDINDFKTSTSIFIKIYHNIEERSKDYNINDGKLIGKQNIPTQYFLLKPDSSLRIVLDIRDKKNQP